MHQPVNTQNSQQNHSTTYCIS